MTAPRLPSPPRETHPRDDADLALRHVLPVVGRQRRGGDAAVLAGGVALVAMLGAITFWSMSRARGDATVAQPVLPPRAAAAAPLAPVPVVPPAAITPLPQAAAGSPPFGPTAALDGARAGAPPGNTLASPALIFNAAPEPAPAPDPAPLPKPAATGATANAADDFANRIGAGGSGNAAAAQAFNPRTTVAQGTLIPAVLETAIDTDVPGYARAIVAADVRSFDGSRVLVPRSSRLVGQYKSGLSAGQRRVYVIWTRLIRPDGVAVALGSPAAGFSGQSGLGGKVDTHFFERFGSAMLLTVLGGLSTLGNGTTGVVIAGTGQSAAAAAVGQTGQIGPTIRVHPGEPLRVFTARDLDFGAVERP